MTGQSKDEDVVNTTISELTVILLFPLGILIAILGYVAMDRTSKPQWNPGFPSCLYEPKSFTNIRGLVRVYVGDGRISIMEHDWDNFIDPKHGKSTWRQEIEKFIPIDAVLPLLGNQVTPDDLHKKLYEFRGRLDQARIGATGKLQCSWYATYFIVEPEDGVDRDAHLESVAKTMNTAAGQMAMSNGQLWVKLVTAILDGHDGSYDRFSNIPSIRNYLAKPPK